MNNENTKMSFRAAASLLLITLLPLVFEGCGRPDHPSDEVLQLNFYRFEPEFERLIRMSNQDSKVIRIAPDFTRLEDNWQWPRHESQWGISRARWEEYRSLFRKLAIEAGISRESPYGSTFLTASTFGLAVSGSEKGYVYSSRAPFPMVKSLDSPEIEVKSLQPIFRHIKGNWYLYYWYDD